MKTLNTIIILTVVISALLFSREANAQSVIILTDSGQVVDCTGDLQDVIVTNDQVNSVVEEDYPYLKNLECIQSGYFTDQRDLDLQLRNINRADNTHFTLSGTGPDINIEASYDQNGNLIDATLVRKNTPVPPAILRFIYSSDEFDGWTMVSNEKRVKDFDMYQTEYSMTLTNGDETQVLHFKDSGNSIAILDR